MVSLSTIFSSIGIVILYGILSTQARPWNFFNYHGDDRFRLGDHYYGPDPRTSQLAGSSMNNNRFLTPADSRIIFPNEDGMPVLYPQSSELPIFLTTQKPENVPRYEQTTVRPDLVSTTTPAATSTTVSPEYTACTRKCQVTMEYDPLCGTDFLGYDNQGKLRCAQLCGKVVQLRNRGKCSANIRG